MATSTTGAARWLRGLLLVVCGVVLGSPCLPADDADEAQESRLARLIEELDDDRFAVREEAKRTLLEIGAPAIARLRQAAESPSPEQRVRALEILREIRVGRLTRAFTAMGRQADDEIEVEEAMWLLATVLDPDLEIAALSAELDRIAHLVRAKLGGAEDLAMLPPGQVVAALVEVLGTDLGLRGDTETYDHPDNSSVHRVLQRKKGLPILLSEIAVAVARRLEVPVVGLEIPGRYMIKYDGAQAPDGFRKEDIIINPFEDWVEVTPPELARTIPGFDARTDLAPARSRYVVVRMLNNMASDALEQGQGALSRELLSYRMLLFPVVE